MYGRIVVAVDGSATGQLALDHALKLAGEQQARVRLVHAVESLHQLVSMAGIYPFDAAGLAESLRAEGRDVLKRAEEKAAASGVAVESALLEGTQPQDRLATLIVNDAREWNADLIVLGTHGRRGLDRLVLGSVAEQVVRNAGCPVLLVRPK